MGNSFGWNIVDYALRDDDLWSGARRNSLYEPDVDLEETDISYVFNLDLPGMKKEDIEVSIVSNTITFAGKRTIEKNSKGAYERRSGTFSRSFRLAKQVNPDEIAATYRDGILTVIVRKKDLAVPKKIEVKN